MSKSIKIKRLVKNLNSIYGFKRKKIDNNLTHVRRALKWLCAAQDSSSDDGVSAGYHLYHGWQNSYPETTGYIIPTFIKCSKLFEEKDYQERALKMADWELEIQNKDGSIDGGQTQNGPDRNELGPLVFDTGQVIFGLIGAYQLTKDDRYLSGATRCCEWLSQHQNSDGTWEKYSFNNIPHTYHTRVSWAMVEVYKHTNIKTFKESAIKNIDWACSQIMDNYWINNCGFNQKNHLSPYTHTIAYTVRGVLESGKLLGNDKYIETAKRCAEALMANISENGHIAGEFKKSYDTDQKYTCLTGSAQISIILMKLFKIFKNETYMEHAVNINRFLKNSQLYHPGNANIDGAIPGSKPIWGNYLHFNLPNWAPKFYIDALLLEDKIANY